MEFRLNCTICFECYDSDRSRPRVLKCGHTICTSCTIRVLMEPNKNCPTCREPCQAENINEVSINYAIDGFLDTPIQAGYPNIHPGFHRSGSVDEASTCSSYGSSWCGRRDSQMSFSNMSFSPGSVFGSPGSYSSSYGSPYFIPGSNYQGAVEDTSPSAPALQESDVPDGELTDSVQQSRQGKKRKSIAGKIGRGALRGLIFLME